MSILLALVAGCTPPSEADEPLPVHADACGYIAAPDLDPDQDVVAVDLVTAPFAWDPGTGTLLEDGLAYNDQVPGPVIEVERGQTLRARFTNGLPHDSTIHWHGLRVPDAMDGAVRMMDTIPAGGDFTYELPMIDAGFYWYHPHMATDQDLERGLYGTIIVREPGEARPDCELPVVLDDVLLDDLSQIAPEDPEEHMQLMGRLGNLLMANGKAGRRVEVPTEGTTLLRFVNSANARYWDLSLPGQTLEVVATDGGWLAEPVAVDRLLVAPGERYTVAVRFAGEEGAEFTLMNDRVLLHAADAEMAEWDPMGDGSNPVMTFVLAPPPSSPSDWVAPAPDVPALTADAAVAHHWVLDEDMDGGAATIDGYAYPDVPPLTIAGDTLTRFEVENASEMHHPLHLHGNRFQVLDVDGVPPAISGWKDTFDVPPDATVTIASELENPGEWMYHCHILEHAELGMAGFLTVE